jgi:DNA-binding MarR family transcriptional regulator
MVYDHNVPEPSSCVNSWTKDVPTPVYRGHVNARVRTPPAEPGPGSAPGTEAFQAGQEAMFLSLQLADRLRQRYVATAEALDLTIAGAKALTVLSPDRPLPMRALARLIHQDPSNLTAVVDRLETRGLIERRGSTDDRRVKSLVITPEGLALAETFRARLAADLGPLEGMAPERIVQLRDILRQVVEPE